MKRFGGILPILLICCVWAVPIGGLAEKAEDACIQCHQKLSPGQVADWKASKHRQEDVSCADCHGTKLMRATHAKSK